MSDGWKECAQELYSLLIHVRDGDLSSELALSLAEVAIDTAMAADAFGHFERFGGMTLDQLKDKLSKLGPQD